MVALDELKRQLYHQERQRDASVGGQCLLLAWIVPLAIVNGHFPDHRHSELTQQNTLSSWTEAVLASSVSARAIILREKSSVEKMPLPGWPVNSWAFS